jgi:small conductance mechanosensitive channel
MNEIETPTQAPETTDAASAAVEPTMMDRVVDFAEAYGPSVIGAILTLIVGMWVAKLIRGIVRRVLVKREIDATLIGFLCSMLYAILMTLVLISAVGRLGVQTTSFIAILGAAGLAVGLALQGSLSNFASGVLLIIFRPFKAGDFVEAGGATGVILEVSIFTTAMKTGDNKRIIIPNSGILGGNITNYSAHDTRRVDMVFGIGYDDDIKKAKELLLKIVNEDERIHADPEPVVAVAELADSSVNFIVRPWVDSGDYWGVYWDVTERVKLEFDAAGISIPFPQQDVHMHQVT